MRKLLLALTALVLCLYPVVGASSPPSGGNFGGVGAWPETVIINMESHDDPFDYAMSRFVDRLVEDGATCSGAACEGDPDSDTPRVVRFVGSITVDQDDFYDGMDDYDVGLLICAGNGRDGNYPEPYGGEDDGAMFYMNYKGDFTLDFTELEIIVDQTGATRRLVPIKFGCGYDTGWQDEDPATTVNPGNQLWGLTVKGTPRIEFTTAVEDGAWNAGHIPTINPNNTTHGAKHGSDDSSIGIWEDGLMYSNLREFHPTLRSPPTDDDNIGYLIGAAGWDVDRGHMDIRDFGVGLYVNGNTVGSTVNGGEIIFNDNNVVIGNPYSGDQIEPVVGGTYSKGATFDSARAAVPSDVELRDVNVEIGAGEYGGLLIYSVSRFTSINSHYEMDATSDGHLIQIGGGWTDALAQGYRPCVFDSDYGAIACTEATGGGTGAVSVRFIGGTISSDKDSNDYDAIAIGDNFDSPSSIFFDTRLGGSDIDKTGAAPDVRLFNIDTLDDGAGGNATGKVDITGAATNTNILPPMYRYVVHHGAYTLSQMFFDVMTTANVFNFTLQGNTAISAVGYGAINLPVPLRNSEMGDFWNVAYLGLSAADIDSVGAAMSGCNIDVTEGAWSAALPVGANLTTTPLTVGTNCGGSCLVDADGESYLMPVMSDITPGDATAIYFTDVGAGDVCNDGAGNFLGSILITYFPRLDR